MIEWIAALTLMVIVMGVGDAIPGQLSFLFFLVYLVWGCRMAVEIIKEELSEVL
jgi:hypothetical protein